MAVSQAIRVATLAAVLVIALISAGCVTMALEDEVVFRPDGSGTAKVTLSALRADMAMAASPEKLTQDLRQALPPGVTLGTRENGTWLYWDMTFAFQDVRQLHETFNQVLRALSGGERGGAAWMIVALDLVPNRGLIRTTFRYAAELKTEFRGDAALLAPSFRGWTHTIVLPGRIQETNGSVRGDRISWKVGADRTLRATATTTMTNAGAMGLLGLLALVVVGGGVTVWARNRRPRTGRWCDQCGAPLPAGARFCDRCGAAASH
jgi:hypothetical protein